MTRAERPIPVDVQAARREQRDAIGRFLFSAFGDDVPAGFYEPRFLDWKLFSPRQDWEGPRSYVFESEGGIVAHGCAWPLSFLIPGGQVRSNHILDWAASPAVAGAGITVYRHLMGFTPTTLVVGGSPAAQRVLRKLGFRPRGTLDIYIRVVRPWRQLCARPSPRRWRDAGRFVRNTIWAFPALSKPEAGWSAVQVARAAECVESVSGKVEKPFCVTGRSASTLEYIMACPIACCELYQVLREGNSLGYFLLNDVAGQCRVVDMQIQSGDRQDWITGYTLALQVAAARPASCEVAVAASLPWIGRELEERGFRLREQKPIALFDPGDSLKNQDLYLNLVDSDGFFMSSPSYPFLT